MTADIDDHARPCADMACDDIFFDALLKALRTLPDSILAELHARDGDDCGVCAAITSERRAQYPDLSFLHYWHRGLDGTDATVTQAARRLVPIEHYIAVVQPIWGAVTHARCLVIYALARVVELERREP